MSASNAPNSPGFVRWFRDSTPYIHAHRGKTFVVSFGGEALADGLFGNLVQDFALLNSLGIRLVLVHGVRPQVEQRLNQRGCQLRYANGLRAALRQAPKVILVGEMRDRDTVKSALSAAETGHLVLSTLHTINAGDTINRILGMFEPDQQEQIRLRLADTLRWVISQRLAPKVGGGRAALLEIMGSNLRTQDSIRMGESEGKTFYEIIEASHSFGWRTFDQACLEGYEQGALTEETALLYCTKRSVVTRGIDTIKKGRGALNDTAGSLRMKPAPASPPDGKSNAAAATAPPPLLKIKTL